MILWNSLAVTEDKAIWTEVSWIVGVPRFVDWFNPGVAL